MSKWKAVRYCFAITVGLLLTACGSNSGPGQSPGTVQTVSGVAAAGAPISGMVLLKDSSTPRRVLTAPIAPDGSFSFDATGLAMPCVLKSIGADGDESSALYSIALSAGTANINPLTNLAVRLSIAFPQEILFVADDPAKTKEAASVFPARVAEVQSVLRGTLSVFDAADVDFVHNKFSANHTGLDLLFDLIRISCSDSGSYPEVSFTDLTAVRETKLPLDSLSSESITITPQTPLIKPGNICIYPFAPVVPTGGHAALSAVVIGNLKQQVSWSVEGADSGTISSTGVYTAPAKAGLYSVTASTSSGHTTIKVQVLSPSLDPFTFADKTVSVSQTIGDVVASDAVTITGWNPDGWTVTVKDTGPVPADVLIDNFYYINGISTPTIRPGQTLRIAQHPSPVIGGSSVTTVTVGPYSTTFTTRTVQ